MCENFGFEGENFEKENKTLKILELFEIFKISNIRDSSFVALLIMRHFIFKSIDRSFKTAPVAVIPVNPYFGSKSVEHDVTLTSFVAEL